MATNNAEGVKGEGLGGRRDERGRTREGEGWGWWEVVRRRKWEMGRVRGDKGGCRSLIPPVSRFTSTNTYDLLLSLRRAFKRVTTSAQGVCGDRRREIFGSAECPVINLASTWNWVENTYQYHMSQYHHIQDTTLPITCTCMV